MGGERWEVKGALLTGVCLSAIHFIIHVRGQLLKQLVAQLKRGEKRRERREKTREERKQCMHTHYKTFTV